MSEKKKPERIFRIGDVSASVFLQNEGDHSPFRTVSLQKSYVDAEDKRQYTGSLSLAELPAAIAVLQRALRYIAEEQAEAVVV